jgi:cob(I)alamin adenosyltransferase
MVWLSRNDKPRATKVKDWIQMAKVTTGTGDTGYTGLLGKKRVPKYDPRPDTFGTVDEATSALGLARATTQDETAREVILHMQRDLYVLMAELATLPENQDAIGMAITSDNVRWLEETEERLKSAVEIPNKFVIPGDSVDGAALDLARTIIRRAERMTVRLLHDGVITNGEDIRYLNRLSDVVFILARYLEAKQGGSTLARA